MSCGCGCCANCGCRATCTCNNSLDFSDFESRSEFSYIYEPVTMNTVVGGDDHDRCSSLNGDEEFSRGPSDAQGASQAHAKKGTSNTWEAHYTGEVHYTCSY